MSTRPVSDAELVEAILQRLKPELHDLGAGIVSAIRATDRDLEHRMYEQATQASARYALKHMVTAKPIRQQKHADGGRLDLLAFALSKAKIDGFYAEFGVFKGETLSFIANRIDKVAYGFDSFEGLPSDWFLGMGKGTFNQNGVLPEIAAHQRNVRLVKGLFSESIPRFAEEISGPAAFIHVDCDLYQSTKDLLEGLADRIVPGTVIVFDEYLNYPGWEEHEVKAFREFCEKYEVKYQYLAFAPTWFSVALIIEAIG